MMSLSTFVQSRTLLTIDCWNPGASPSPLFSLSPLLPRLVLSETPRAPPPSLAKVLHFSSMFLISQLVPCTECLQVNGCFLRDRLLSLNVQRRPFFFPRDSFPLDLLVSKWDLIFFISLFHPADFFFPRYN